ncbi:DUF4238 domain-containing protein [Candidatus Rariloculus sp.]|uniref:DUF4238 domain-containing protein n=1 Tax=Candidatus Rariloculus sp. TaxID=3101265 RepID=UPI003D11EBA9
MNKAKITRQNHYVPIWYQRGFIRGPKSTLQYLDLNPPTTELPSGEFFVEKELLVRSPKLCFREKDLYTTRFGRTLNDEIEKFLFGKIDASGATAVRAFAGNDPQIIHQNFRFFFDFLNAQKLRTPKGLDWIRTRFPSLTQVDLMVEMQHLRQMHCTMWYESVREIVSAEESDVKFIVTDHPVTVYNSACDPASSICKYPEDPSIGLNGTQTVFALDAEHCLILTNLEFARDPTGVDLLAPRQNARYSGHTLTRTDAMIRTRMLTPDEVVSINFLLKARSRQYLAAYEEEWLFPERYGVSAWNTQWKDIGTVLLPPSDLLWHFGGEIYIGHKDGSTHYQDAFGRTDTTYKLLKKKASPKALGPNDSCGCGSGRKYKKCCDGIRIEERPPWHVYSIRDRNLMFCNAVVDILGLNKGKTWEHVRRELSNDQVKRIHEMLEILWPKDTNIADLLARPDKRVFRAVYMGLVDPRTIAVSVISSLAYFDEIVVVNPFPNPVSIDPKFSPTRSPAQHKSQMLKNVSVLLTLQPFIDAGTVHLVPDPMDFDADLRRAMMAMIKERTANWQLTNKEMEHGLALARDDGKRTILRLPKDQLRRIVLESQPDIGTELLERTIDYMKEELVQDPLALLQPIQDPTGGGELQVFRSMNLELAMFIAQLTGATIYTDDPSFWRQLHKHTSAASNAAQRSRWTPLIEKIESLTFAIEANPLINLETRHSGKLGRIRRVFRRMLNAALTHDENADMEEIAEQLAGSLERAGVRTSIEWDTCTTTTGPSNRLRRLITFSAPDTGFHMNSVHRLLITSGRTNYIQSVPIALLLAFDSGQDELFAQKSA